MITILMYSTFSTKFIKLCADFQNFLLQFDEFFFSDGKSGFIGLHTENPIGIGPN